MLYVTFMWVSLGLALVVRLLLPDDIYPKYSLPIPMYLPFQQQRSLIAFSSNLVGQTILCIQAAGLGIYGFGILFCIVVHIFGFLGIVEEFIGKIRKEIVTKSVVTDQAEPSTSKTTLQMAVLTVINRSGPSLNRDIPFAQWMQIVTEMVSDVNSTITSLSELYTENFFLHEQNLCALFLCGLVVTFENKQYLFAVPGFLYVLCLVNEKILDKFENILSRYSLV